LNGLDLKGALVFFYPQQSDVFWFAPAIAWAEALAVTVLAIGRIALGEKSSVPALV
jgi:hypothetical protein